MPLRLRYLLSAPLASALAAAAVVVLALSPGVAAAAAGLVCAGPDCPLRAALPPPETGTPLQAAVGLLLLSTVALGLVAALLRPRVRSDLAYLLSRPRRLRVVALLVLVAGTTAALSLHGRAPPTDPGASASAAPQLLEYEYLLQDPSLRVPARDLLVR